MTTVTFDTQKFGQLEVDDEHIIHFIAPIIGFDNDRRFVLLPHRDESPFVWLQSVDNGALAFVLTSPAQFDIPYEIEIPENAVKALELTQAEDVIVMTLVTIPDGNPSLMTTNLLAPIIINQANLKAIQIVLDDPKLEIRHRLLPDNKITGPSATAVDSSTST